MYICNMKTLTEAVHSEAAKAKQELLKRYSEEQIDNIIKPIVEKTLSQIKIQVSAQKIVHDN